MYLFIVPIVLATIMMMFARKRIKLHVKQWDDLIRSIELRIPYFEALKKKQADDAERWRRHCAGEDVGFPPLKKRDPNEPHYTLKGTTNLLKENEDLRKYKMYLNGEMHNKRYEAIKEVEEVLLRISSKYLWFLVLSAIIVVFHNSSIAKIPAIFFGTFVVSHVIRDDKHRKFLLIYQILLNILLIGVYALRPF